MKEFNSIVMVQKVKMEKLFLIYGTLEMVQQVQKSAHVYGEKGAYTVELTVKDSRGKESKEQTKVTVKQDRKQDPLEKVLPFNKLVKEI